MFLSFTSFTQIAVDGFYDDWTNIAGTSDGQDSQDMDITSVKISNDDEFLYFLIETDQEFDLQDDEGIRIYVDADNNPATGFSIGGIGSEMSYDWGDRNGYINLANTFINVGHADLGMIALPTVTSDKFEIAFRRSINSSLGSFAVDGEIKVYVDNGFGNDQVPNNDGGIAYTIQQNTTFAPSYDLEKSAENIRLMSYNVLRDGFLESDQNPSLEAVIKSMNPDILCLQEVYDTPSSQILDMLEDLLPTGPGKQWYAATAGPDIHLYSTIQIEAWDWIDGNGVFLLYTDNNEPLVVYNVHLPCCANDVDRQDEIDKILSVLRDKEDSPLTGFSYDDDFPEIITGDFNLVGFKQNYDSFIEGDIVNEAVYGSDFGPDLDGSTLEDANPYLTGIPSNYTWYQPNSSYNPGRLDFVFYTGAGLTQQNAFVLNSSGLSQAERDQLNLNADATLRASDHLPLVFDFTFGMEADNDGDGFTESEDCDDNNASINPGAQEIPNNAVDEDCDGIALIIDQDMDGFNSDDDCDDTDPNVNPGEPEIPNNGVDEDCDGIAQVIDQDMDGYNSDEDCDDSNAGINPNATEVPNNNVDEDCDGIAQMIDEDMDGFNSDEDCDDNNPNVNPGQMEIPNNGIDEDCDGFDEVVDQDMDGFTSDVDCNDMDAGINPGQAEIPNNDIDEDCDGIAQMIDEDMDGFNSDEDCNDTDAAINPDAIEIANNDIDEDCDGIALIIDEDGDSFNSDEDCDDTDAAINPDATEIPNNDIDEDCDGMALIIDEDGDGFNSDEDCDDMNATIFPGADEIPNNGIDEDCDGEDFTTSVLEADWLEIDIYPNPASSNLYITHNHHSSMKLEFYDILGQKQLSQKLTHKESMIELDGLPSGKYIIRCETNDQKLAYRSIIKL